MTKVWTSTVAWTKRVLKFSTVLFALGIVLLWYNSAGFRALLQTAPHEAGVRTILPEISLYDTQNWLAAKARYLDLFQSELYGTYPDNLTLEITREETVHPAPYMRARLTYFSAAIKQTNGDFMRPFPIALIRPNDQAGQNETVPLILIQSFCSVRTTAGAKNLPASPSGSFDCNMDKFPASLAKLSFGENIATPPIQTIIDRGYAVAIMHPPNFIPDRAEPALWALKEISKRNGNAISRSETPGALITWAAQLNLVSNFFSKTSDYSYMIAMGHSRYGKSVLIAAAFNPNIDGIIAHQAGTAGAAPSKNKPGEQLADMVQQYPHWLNSKAADYAENPSSLSVEQHMLLAALAPRPLLLGNSRRDVWSDPEGTFASARAASKIYEAAGTSGLTAVNLDDFHADSQISYWIRRGPHGIRKNDWAAFLNFLDAHFMKNRKQ